MVFKPKRGSPHCILAEGVVLAGTDRLGQVAEEDGTFGIYVYLKIMQRSFKT